MVSKWEMPTLQSSLSCTQVVVRASLPRHTYSTGQKALLFGGSMPNWGCSCSPTSTLRHTLHMRWACRLASGVCLFRCVGISVNHPGISWQTGVPIMRQHILHFPNDTTAIKQAQQVLWHTWLCAWVYVCLLCVCVYVCRYVCMYVHTYVVTYVCVCCALMCCSVIFLMTLCCFVIMQCVTRLIPHSPLVHVWPLLPGCSSGKGRSHFMECLPTNTQPEGTNEMAGCRLNNEG